MVHRKWLTTLTDGSVEERIKAAEALGSFRGQDVIVALAGALRDKSYRVRSHAVESLGRIGGREAVAATTYALRDSYEQVRLRAIENLGALGGEEAIAPLIGVLEGNEDFVIKLCTIDSMWSLADPRFAPSLKACLGDDEPLIRGHAAAALGRIGQPSTILILEALVANESSPQAQVGLHGALAAMGRHASLRNLAELLEHPDSQVRCAVAGTLSDIVRESNRLPLLRMLESAMERETCLVARFALETSLVDLHSGNKARVA